MLYARFEPYAVAIFRHGMIKLVSQDTNCYVIKQCSRSGDRHLIWTLAWVLRGKDVGREEGPDV